MLLGSPSLSRCSTAAVRPRGAGTVVIPARVNAGRSLRGFTLIELVLVMAILTVAVSFTAPVMSRFFGGRTLDSEARRLLAMTRAGQSRAISEGIVVDMWFDEEHSRIGLEAQQTFERTDAKKEEFDLDPSLKLQVSTKNMVASSNVVSQSGSVSMASILKKAPAHANLPAIHFQPDGTFGENSPKAVELMDRSKASIWIGLGKTRTRYEIRATEN